VREFKRMILLASLLFILAQALAAGGCQGSPVPPTPTPTMIPPTPSPTPLPPTPVPPTPTSLLIIEGTTYSNATLGLSMWYPENWLYEEEEEWVVLGTSQQVIAGGELTAGAGLTLFVDPLPDPGLHSVEELCRGQASVFASEEMEVSEPQPRNIGEQDGAMLTFEGIPGLGENPIKGLIAATIWEDWAYTFVALSVADEWDDYGPILERMLDGIHFIPQEQPEYAPDVWEPDDSLAEASEIETGSPQTHDLHTQADRDWLYFPATRGHIYTIETANLGDDIDTEIYLYDDEGNLLAQNDDGRSMEEPWASRLVWAAERTNILYVMIQNVDDDDAGPGTVYDIRIWEEVIFVEDEFEPDDSPEKASLLKVEKPQPHNLHILGDHDWLRFQASAGNTHVIQTYDLGPGVDTVVHLFNEEGNELALNDNGSDEEEPLASRIQWTARRDAPLYILIHDSGDDGAGPGTEYWVRLLETSP
jgi:hypothetical protein